MHGGTHYKELGVEPWDAMEAWMTPEQFQGFLLGSAIGYLARFNTTGNPSKGGVTDIKKAAHYLQKLIEIADAQQKPDLLRQGTLGANQSAPMRGL
jgi:hypothetical protein